MSDPRLATLEAVEADRDYWREQTRLASSADEARRREIERLRRYLEEARSRTITFCAMLEDDPILGGQRLYVVLRDNVLNIVVNNTIVLPYPDMDPRLFDEWLLVMLAQGSDKVAKEYAYALVQVQQ